MPTETIINVERPDNGRTENNKKVGTELFSGVQWNTKYFETFPGILQILELALGLLCILTAAPAYSSVTQWFLFVVIVSFILTVIWIFMHFLSIRENLNLPINWPITEFMNMALVAIAYLVISIIQISAWIAAHDTRHTTSNIAAGVFGLCNVVAYITSCYYSLKEWRNIYLDS